MSWGPNVSPAQPVQWPNHALSDLPVRFLTRSALQRKNKRNQNEVYS